MLKEPVRIIAFDIGGTHGRVGLLHCKPPLAASPLHASGHRGRQENHPSDLHMLPPFEIEPLKLEMFQRNAGESGARWLARLIDSARRIAPELPRAAAVSFGGPVSPDGRILSMHVAGWEKVDLAGEIAEAFRISRSAVAVENDANAGALGEHRFGAGRGVRDMLFFTVSTGIGGGVILDGKLRRGAHGFAGEFGHMIMDSSPNAPQYASGKPGALEALASGPAIAREGLAALKLSGSDAPERLDARSVFIADAAGEPWAVQTIERITDNFARGIAAAICAYDVERVVIGGGVAQAGDLLFVPLREKVEKYLPVFMHSKVQILPASLGDKAPMYGAAAACLE